MCVRCVCVCVCDVCVCVRMCACLCVCVLLSYLTYILPQSKQVPPMYLQELEGLAAGAKDNGCDLCGVYVTRYIVLANVPSDAKDMLKIFMREWNRTKTSDWMNFNKKHSHRGLMCSMFAVWGSRTNGSKLFSSRNLDWNPGIHSFALC